MSFKIGQGYDVHQLKDNIPLYIGGVNIKHTKGIVAHSDGDILIHVIIDAIFGACNLGDLGQHFANTDEWENVSGLFMLTHALKIVKHKFSSFKIINIDSTIILQTPKMSNYIQLMKENIATTLEMSIDDLSIKATTTDKLGFVGLEKGIAAQAVCLIEIK